MELTSQVTSLDLSRQLKAMGFPQWNGKKGEGSLFYWRKRTSYKDLPGDAERWYLTQINTYYPDTDVSAYTVSELGEFLPQSLDAREVCPDNKKERGKRYDLVIENPRASTDGWQVSYYWGWTREANKESWSKTFDDISEANARAKMLIYLKQNHLI